jgi:ABC-type antimicrobial peptide transport system permease subunit
VREVIREVDARVPVLELASLESVQERDEFVERGLARAAAFLGLVALLLATVGLYGVTSYVVAMRTRELAIRLAIGALPRQVLRIVLDQSLGLVALGGVIGGVIAAGVGALIQAQAFGVAGVDWAALLGSALLLVLVMLFASAVPARRAARLDPGRVLREG